MKTIVFKIANLLLFVLSSALVFAQPVITSNTSSPSSCDGSAQFVDSSNVVSTSIYWSDSSNVIQQGGYYLYGLCPGVYTVTYTDSSASNQTYTFNIGSGSSNPCAGFSASMSTWSSTDSANCNGSVSINIYGGTYPFTYSWNSPGIVGGYDSTLCSGLYTCVVTDANGCVYTTQGNVADSSGNSGNPCSGFYTIMNVTAASDSLTCNEAATVSVFGGTAPYTFNWNNPSYADSTNTLSYVCDGTYTCIVTDANGCAYTASGSADTIQDPCAGFYAYISTYPSFDSLSCDGNATVYVTGGTAHNFSWSTGNSGDTNYASNLCQGSYYCVVSDTINGCVYTASGYVYISNWNPSPSDSVIVIDNGSYGDSLIVDTLGTQWVSDCNLEMSIIDSAFISGYTYGSIDSVYVTWVLLDSTGNSIATYTTGYFVGGTSSGVVTTNLIIYCMMKSPNSQFISISDQIYLNSAEMGIVEQLADDTKFINPFDKEIKLEFSSVENRKIQIFDLLGSLILETECNSDSFVHNTSEFKNGTYFIHVNEAGNVKILKLIK